jgi:flagellin
MLKHNGKTKEVEVNCMLSGLTAKTLGRYQEATRMVEETMSRLASGTADLGSADRIKVGRINNTIHTLQTANKVVKQNQDLLESALAGTDAITAVVNKMKEVAAEAQDDQLTGTQRQALVDEYNELAKEIDFVAKNTEYDGTELIDGTFGIKSFVIDGVSVDQTVSVELGDLTLEGLQLGAYTDANNAAVAVSKLDTVADAEDAVTRLEAALATLEGERSNQLAKIERFDFTISHMNRMISMNEESVATINDFDEASEMAKLTSYRIEQQTAIALMAQAQQLSANVLQLLQG